MLQPFVFILHKSEGALIKTRYVSSHIYAITSNISPKLVTWIRVRNFQFSLFTYIPIFGVIRHSPYNYLSVTNSATSIEN